MAIITFDTTDSRADTIVDSDYLLTINASGEPNTPTAALLAAYIKAKFRLPDDVTTALSGSGTDLAAGAPTSLNTLDKLAAAINDDPNFHETVAVGLADKLAADAARVVSIDGMSINTADHTLHFGWTDQAGLARSSEIDLTAFLNSVNIAVDGTTIGGSGTTGSPYRVANPFTPADKAKLDGQEAGATADQTGAEIVNRIDQELGTTTWQSGGGGGGGTPIPPATPQADGLMSHEDKAKLDGQEAGATADQSATEIKTLYEVNPDTNAFTDAEKLKLRNAEDGATADQTGDEVAALLDAALGGTTWRGGGSGGGTGTGTIELGDALFNADVDVTNLGWTAVDFTIEAGKVYWFNIGRSSSTDGDPGDYEFLVADDLLAKEASTAGGGEADDNNLFYYAGGGVGVRIARTSENKLLINTLVDGADLLPFQVFEPRVSGVGGGAGLTAEQLAGLIQDWALANDTTRIPASKLPQDIETLDEKIDYQAAVHDDALTLTIDPDSRIYETAAVTGLTKGSSPDGAYIQRFNYESLIVPEALFEDNNDFADVTKIIYGDREYAVSNWSRYTQANGLNGWGSTATKNIAGKVWVWLTFDSTDLSQVTSLVAPKRAVHGSGLTISNANDSDNDWGDEATAIIRGIHITEVTSSVLRGYRTDRVSASRGDIQQFALALPAGTMSSSTIQQFGNPDNVGALTAKGTDLFMLNPEAEKINAYSTSTNAAAATKDITLDARLNYTKASIVAQPDDDRLFVIVAMGGGYRIDVYSLATADYGDRIDRIDNFGIPALPDDNPEDLFAFASAANLWVGFSYSDAPARLFHHDIYDPRTGHSNSAYTFAAADANLGTAGRVYGASILGDRMYFVAGTTPTETTKLIGRDFSGAATSGTGPGEFLLERSNEERIHFTETTPEEVRLEREVVPEGVIGDPDTDDFDEMLTPHFYRIAQRGYRNGPVFPGSTAPLAGTLEVAYSKRGGFVSIAVATAANAIAGTSQADEDDVINVASRDVVIGTGTSTDLTDHGHVLGSAILQAGGVQVPFVFHYRNFGRSTLYIADQYHHLIPAETTIAFEYESKNIARTILKANTTTLSGKTLNGSPVTTAFQSDNLAPPDDERLSTIDATGRIDLAAFAITGDGLESGHDTSVSGKEQVYRGYNNAVAHRIIDDKGVIGNWSVVVSPLDHADVAFTRLGAELPASPDYDGQEFVLTSTHGLYRPGRYFATATSAGNGRLTWINIAGALPGTFVHTTAASRSGPAFPTDAVDGEVFELTQDSQQPGTDDFRLLHAVQGAVGTDADERHIGYRGPSFFSGEHLLGAIHPDAGGSAGDNLAAFVTWYRSADDQWGMWLYVKSSLLQASSSISQISAAAEPGVPGGGRKNDSTGVHTSTHGDYTEYNFETDTQWLHSGHDYVIGVEIRNASPVFPVTPAPRGTYQYDAATNTWTAI